jgi:predicted peptidase
MTTRRYFCFSFGVALFLPHLTATAAEKRVFLAKTYQNADGETMPYRLFVPASYDKKKKYPLVLWLHGGAGRGRDNSRQISEGNQIGSHVWTEPRNQMKHPCFVLAPQCPPNEVWATVATAEPTKQMQLVLELLKDLQKEFSIDPQRLYVAGQSMGGFGTWSVITQHPGLFAAAIPICGGGDVSKASRLIETPIWAFHGEKDEAVSVSRSRQMIETIKQAGGKPRYTECKDAGHVIWEKVFSEPELLSWTFAQKRASSKGDSK